MEHQPPPQRNPLLLLVGVLVVLILAGLAAWKLLKLPAQEKKTDPNKPPVGGRSSASEFSEEERQYSTLNPPSKGGAKNGPIPMQTPEGQRIIEEEVRRVQTLNDRDFRQLRAQHQIGRELYNIPQFTRAANGVIQSMLAGIPGVDAKDYSTYPIYGKHEEKGKQLRKDLNQFLNRPKETIQQYGFGHYSQLRGQEYGDWWWFGSIGVNILYFSDDPDLATPWQMQMSQVNRQGVDNFKVINRHDEADGNLTRWMQLANGQTVSVFAAWGAVDFCKALRAECDRLDRVTRMMVIDALFERGIISKYTLPTDQQGGGKGKLKI